MKSHICTALRVDVHKAAEISGLDTGSLYRNAYHWSIATDFSETTSNLRWAADTIYTWKSDDQDAAAVISRPDPTEVFSSGFWA